MPDPHREGDSRGRWGSRTGFLLAAAGSAVGLGNVWRFPYITGENGGGAFVLLYLACIVFVGLPILVAEVLLGRASQRSPVGAFRALGGRKTPWRAVGWLGVFTAFWALSFYVVVAGWTLHYLVVSLSGGLAGSDTEAIAGHFSTLQADAGSNVLWTAIFIGLTVVVVLGGVRGGLERWSKVLMPALFGLFLVLLVRATALDGFRPAVDFIFGFHADDLTPVGVLEALGHSFFTLSVGIGGLLTYGSYLRPDADLPGSGVAIAVLDTAIALLACLVLFPILFSYGLDPDQGPGLIFANLPIAFAQMPAGALLGGAFFALLAVAALTSAISLLEVVTAYLVDERRWRRGRAAITAGAALFVAAVPAALSGGDGFFGAGMTERFGTSWFGAVADLTSNWLIPLGGLGIALFAGWRLSEPTRRAEFARGSALGRAYAVWLFLLRWVGPVAVVAVFLHAIGWI